MPDLLYLDTARLGRMSPTAQRAERALVSLAAEEGCSAHFDRFVRQGWEASPLAVNGHYSGLENWAGVGELKRALRALTGLHADLPILVAHRAAQLMKLAARVLMRTCRNVLVTDLGWPGYHETLIQEAGRANRRVTPIEVRTGVLSGQLLEADLIDRMCSAFSRERCDGLFLSAVSSWGARIPVQRIVRRLEASHKVWCVVVDGSQEFCHAPEPLDTEYCDLYLTGCHKWLGSHHPMGLGFCGWPRSRAIIDTIATHMTATGDLDDPLLRFSTQLETGSTRPIETLNLTPLFTARAATEDARRSLARSSRTRNGELVATVAPSIGWKPMQPDLPLRSGILLLKAERAVVRSTSPETLRTMLRDAGVVATTYEGGVVRLSMPATEFTDAELEHLTCALHTTA